MINPTDRRPLIAMIMHASDDVVAVITYRDEWGRLSQREVSPIRWLGAGKFLGLCLGRERPRTFYLGRCVDIKAKAACDAMAGSPVKRLRPKLGA